MTLATTDTSVSYVGNDSTTAFPVTFPFFGTGTDAEIRVVSVLIADGTETVQTNGTDYTVTGGSGSTGTVTAAVAPASTVRWVIRRNTTQTQETDYIENDDFPADSHEKALDRLTAIAQEQETDLSRTIQFTDGYTGGADPTLPEPAADTIIGWDATGLAMNNFAQADFIGATGPQGPQGDPGTDGTDGADGTDGVFAGTEATVALAATDKVAIIDVSDSDSPKYFLPTQQLVDLLGITFSAGDILYHDGTNLVRLAAGSNDQVLTLAAGAPSWADAASGGNSEIFIVKDEKASGTGGGTFTSGAWRTRDLNTEDYNNITGASLASNQITLPAGTYKVTASAPARDVLRHQCRLYDTTGSAELVKGSSEYTNSSGNVTTQSILSGVFTLGVTSVLELQHQCSTTAATVGFGAAASTGGEVYSTVTITKLA